MGVLEQVPSAQGLRVRVRVCVCVGCVVRGACACEVGTQKRQRLSRAAREFLGKCERTFGGQRELHMRESLSYYSRKPQARRQRGLLCQQHAYLADPSSPFSATSNVVRRHDTAG